MFKKPEVDDVTEVAGEHTGQSETESLEYLLEEEDAAMWCNWRYEDLESKPRMPQLGKGNGHSRDSYGNGRRRKHRQGKKDRRSIRKDDVD